MNFIETGCGCYTSGQNATTKGPTVPELRFRESVVCSNTTRASENSINQYY